MVGEGGPLGLEKGEAVSPSLSDSGVIAGSPAPPELIRAIITKMNMRELVVSSNQSQGVD